MYVWECFSEDYLKFVDDSRRSYRNFHSFSTDHSSVWKCYGKDETKLSEIATHTPHFNYDAIVLMYFTMGYPTRHGEQILIIALNLHIFRLGIFASVCCFDGFVVVAFINFQLRRMDFAMQSSWFGEANKCAHALKQLLQKRLHAKGTTCDSDSQTQFHNSGPSLSSLLTLSFSLSIPNAKNFDDAEQWQHRVVNNSCK